MTTAQLDATLSRIALYEQAKAYQVKRGQNPGEFLENQLSIMYQEISSALQKFVAKELRVLV